MSSVLILAAVVVGLVNLALPWLASDPVRLAAWIESRIGQSVSIEAAGGQWLRSGPAFRLKHLRLGGDDGIEVDAAELRINVYAWLLPRRALVELRLSGLDLDISREAGGRWELKGLVLPRSEAAGPATVDARLPGALSVRDSRLRVRDAESGLDLALERVHLTFSRERGREFWNGSAWPVEGSAPLGFVIERAGDGGRAYLVGRELELSEWLGQATPLGIGLREGRADIEAWLDWKGRRLSDIRLEVDLSGLSLRGATPLLLGEEAIEPRRALARVAFGARWRAASGGWRLDVEDLRLFAQGEDTVGPALSLTRSDKTRYRLEVERLSIGPLLALAALADGASPALRGVLYASAATGRLEDLVVDFEDGRLVALRGYLESLSTRPHRGTPGIGPLSMHVFGDAQGIVAAIEDQYPLLDAPRLLRKPLRLHGLDARVGIRTTAEGVEVELADAAVQLGGIGFDFDASLAFGAEDGPVLSGAVQLGKGRIEQLHELWPAGILPPRTLHWLETALVSGEFRSGAAVFHGPLQAWPFEQGEGRFVAQAEVGDTLMAFHPEWPPVEALEAGARFVNVGMDIEARSARIAGNRIDAGHAVIPDLDNAVLDIQIEGGGRGSQLLGLLRRSPLNHRFGSHLIGVEVGGRGDVRLDLHFVLKQGLDGDRVAGEVWLRQADLRDAKWGLAFDRATGPIRFDEDGFSADELKVWLGEDPAHLSIAVGGRTGDPANLAEASLRGVLPLASVTSGFSDLEPLWPRVQGRSHWTLDLAVERGEHGLDGPKRLLMHSDMVGAAIDLPAPLQKPAEESLPVRMEVSLPQVDGQLAVRLGDLASIQAQLPGP
ncbi:MAG TPA: DUF3971 domain-containing protein, partial [Xanthomonadaceae bacterium]|nr:DUF3971 domain-containing protein [Xanthomonadaceae bacterium]